MTIAFQTTKIWHLGGFFSVSPWRNVVSDKEKEERDEGELIHIHP
jgi:hypothetical protein